MLAHLLGHVVTDRVHGRAPVERAAEERLEPCRLRSAQLGEAREGEVVHRHDDRRASGRRDEVRGVDHVDRAGPALDRGPRPALPEPMDRTRRHPRGGGARARGQHAAEVPAPASGHHVGLHFDVVAPGRVPLMWCLIAFILTFFVTRTIVRYIRHNAGNDAPRKWWQPRNISGSARRPRA